MEVLEAQNLLFKKMIGSEEDEIMDRLWCVCRGAAGRREEEEEKKKKREEERAIQNETWILTSST